MKVALKKPNESLTYIEVADIKEINQILGNFDNNNQPRNIITSDIRGPFVEGIDFLTNELALFNENLPTNIFHVISMRIYRGNVMFAGHNDDSKETFGLCSLSEENIKTLNDKFYYYFENYYDNKK